MFERDFENVAQTTREDDRQHGVYGDHTIRAKVQPVPVDYREMLGDPVCAHIKQNYGMFYSRLYPELK